jgi:hypothetical protein
MQLITYRSQAEMAVVPDADTIISLSDFKEHLRP